MGTNWSVGGRQLGGSRGDTGWATGWAKADTTVGAVALVGAVLIGSGVVDGTAVSEVGVDGCGMAGG